MLLVRFALAFLIATCSIPSANAAIFVRGRQLMVCHRTANRDAPENSLEAIRESRILGCDVVEMDISRTLDGVLVLLHDGPIDRVSSGSGEIEKTLSQEMTLYDAGDWFNSRFRGIRQPRFIDALRLCKDLGLKIELDLKSKGITREMYEMVSAEGMLDRVSFGGHAEELPLVAPNWARQSTASWQPGMGRAEVSRLQEQGKFVVADFSFNDHELDFPLMQKAVAAGIDALNTDRPRVAAEALGRSIEARALHLTHEARQGEWKSRVQAIARLSEFRDLPLTAIFASLIWDAEPAVSRASVVALAHRRDTADLPAWLTAFDGGGKPAHAAANLAWLAGISGSADRAAFDWLVRMAASPDLRIAEESLRALGRLDGAVPAALLHQRIDDPHPLLRGAAALALARHDEACMPALRAAAARLQKEIYACWSSYMSTARSAPAESAPLGKGRTTFERPPNTGPAAAAKIKEATELYRAYQNVIRAIASMHNPEGDKWLRDEALRVAPDFSGIGEYVAASQLWDRPDTPSLAIGLESDAAMPRDRTEWTLLKHGASSAQALRALLDSKQTEARIRAAQTLAWLGDAASKPALSRLIQSDPDHKDLYEWCLRKLAEVEQLRHGAY